MFFNSFVFADCEDSNENCDFWQEQGYCNETSEYSRVREVCHKSCGVCTSCPKEECRSTAFSPIKEEAGAQKSAAALTQITENQTTPPATVISSVADTTEKTV